MQEIAAAHLSYLHAGDGIGTAIRIKSACYALLCLVVGWLQSRMLLGAQWWVVVQALVLTPTREIALQVAAVLRALAAEVPGLVVGTLIGGLPIEDDQKLLRRQETPCTGVSLTAPPPMLGSRNGQGPESGHRAVNHRPWFPPMMKLWTHVMPLVYLAWGHNVGCAPRTTPADEVAKAGLRRSALQALPHRGRHAGPGRVAARDGRAAAERNQDAGAGRSGPAHG